MSDSSFLEYLFEAHKIQLTKPSAYLALLCHAMLLDRKAKLKNGKAVLPEDWNQSDPIRLSYTAEDGREINVAVLDSSGEAYITVTEDKSDLLGHLEIQVDDYINMAPNLSLGQSYPLMTDLKNRINESIWSVIFATKKEPTGKFPESSRIADPFHSQNPFRRPNNPLYDQRFVGPPTPFDYGRRDLDPFAIANDPLRIGGAPSSGGMLFDPRRGLIDDRPLYPGAPPGSVPPGARIDPIMPFPGRPSRGGGASRPDPDMPTPPGWEDMYL